jgi:hypothetical protein
MIYCVAILAKYIYYSDDFCCSLHLFATEGVGSSNSVSNLELVEVRSEYRLGQRLSWLRFSWHSSAPPGKFRNNN